MAWLGWCAPLASEGSWVGGAAEDRPLPTVDEVISGLLEQSALEAELRQAFLQRYAHVVTRVREERSPAGRLRRRTEERLVHEPVSEAGCRGYGAETRKGSQYGERDIALTDELLQRFAYQVEGREETDGRWLVRVSFRPRGEDLPQRSMLDRFINRTAGTLWLDASSFALVKARMSLMEEVSFLAGIAGVVHSLDAVWERASTPEGLWYTRRGAWQVDFRQFLVRKIVGFEERREEVELVLPEAGLAPG